MSDDNFEGDASPNLPIQAAYTSAYDTATRHTKFDGHATETPSGKLFGLIARSGPSAKELLEICRESASFSWRASKKQQKTHQHRDAGEESVFARSNVGRGCATHDERAIRQVYRYSPISRYPSSHRCFPMARKACSHRKQRSGGMNGTVVTSKSCANLRLKRWPWVIHTRQTMHRETTPLQSELHIQSIEPSH